MNELLEQIGELHEKIDELNDEIENLNRDIKLAANEAYNEALQDTIATLERMMR